MLGTVYHFTLIIPPAFFFCFPLHCDCTKSYIRYFCGLPSSLLHPCHYMKCKGFLPQSGSWLQGLTTVWLLPSFIVTHHSIPTCHPKSLLCAFVPAVQRPKASPYSPFIHTTLTHNFSLNFFALAHFLPESFSNLPAYLSSSYGRLLFALPSFTVSALMFYFWGPACLPEEAAWTRCL